MTLEEATKTAETPIKPSGSNPDAYCLGGYNLQTARGLVGKTIQFRGKTNKFALVNLVGQNFVVSEPTGAYSVIPAMYIIGQMRNLIVS